MYILTYPDIYIYIPLWLLSLAVINVESIESINRNTLSLSLSLSYRSIRYESVVLIDVAQG